MSTVELDASETASNAAMRRASSAFLAALQQSLPKPPRPVIAESGHTLPGRILRAVSYHFNLTPENLLKDDRHQRRVVARAVAIRLLRDVKCSDGAPRYSFPRIGQIMGGRDHSTIIHACDRFGEYLSEHPRAAQVYARLSGELHS